jgi:hypothetical protein
VRKYRALAERGPGPPTGKTFNESARNFELQRDKEFTLHVCAQSPKSQKPERKA